MTSAKLSYSQLFSEVGREIENSVDKTIYDVIVIGIGSMGSSACYHLAKKGYSVLGLEQFDIPHELGSHSGQSRIIRKAYGETSAYVPLLERAYENWKILESETGSQVYYKTGLVYFGTPNDTFLSTVKESSHKYKIPLNQLSRKECARKYPQFNLPDDFELLEEPDAGLLSPEMSILLLVRQALLRGAVFRTREKVLEWKKKGNAVSIKTTRATYHAKKLVVTAGPWAGKIMPDLASKIKVTRQVLAWVNPKKTDNFTLGKFPCWLLEKNGFKFYGFPMLPTEKFTGPWGLKLGLHYPNGELTDPDEVNRETNEADEYKLIQLLKEHIPNAYQNTLEMKTCLYTNTFDGNFILDHLPGSKTIIIATAFNGHGYKFASVIGEIVADLAINGSTSLPIEFLNAKRFNE